jgi:hypothetical protein
MRSHSRFRLWTAVALLSGYAIFALHSAYSFNSWVWGLEGLVFFVAAAGLASRMRWSAYLVFALAILLCGFWIHSVWLVANSGYFAGISATRRILSLVPGLVMLALAGYCCVVSTTETSASPQRT